MSSARDATKRLLRELETWDEERKEEKGIERLGPVSEGDLFAWEAVINGRGVGGGYDGLFIFFPNFSSRFSPSSLIPAHFTYISLSLSLCPLVTHICLP